MQSQRRQLIEYHVLCDSIYEMLRIGKYVDRDSILGVVKRGGRPLSVNGYGVSFWGEKIKL